MLKRKLTPPDQILIGCAVFSLLFFIIWGIYNLLYENEDSIIESLYVKKMRKQNTELTQYFVPVLREKKYNVVLINNDIIPEDLARIRQLAKDRNESLVLYESYAKQAFDKAVRNLAESESFTLIDRSKIEIIKNEQRFQISDWSNSKKTSELGKALNADCIASISITIDKTSFTAKTEILDINTMESKVSLRSNLDELSTLYFENSRKNTLPSKKMRFTGIKVTEKKYSKEEINKITPFLQTINCSKSEIEKYSDFENLKNIQFDLEDELCTVTFFGKGETQCDFVFIAGNPLLIIGGLKNEDSKYQRAPATEETSDAGLYSYYFTNGYIGRIKIIGDNINVSGDMYYYNNAYAIHVGSEKPNGTGKQYFAFFSAI